ncbi:coiled-coil domain-containing protein [Phlyctema vagabunda]|uniref:Coiled-coil domain-containing protein n=1 Tax=Phlyctema vagabunda TaxID=108571 RepID=A0ABR4P727_9HELO
MRASSRDFWDPKIMPHIVELQMELQEESFKDAERTEKLRVKNRRKLYLDGHPEYFTNADLELQDPLLYDRCVRRFQSAAEREADGRSKGYSGVLEADLMRSEAKIAALAGNQDARKLEAEPSQEPVPFVSYNRGENGEVLPEEEDEVPQNKEEGFDRWKFEMTLRFLRGEDKDFDYHAIDQNEDFDAIEHREEEEKWFEDEEPEWVGDEEEGKETIGGETGIQDF